MNQDTFSNAKKKEQASYLQVTPISLYIAILCHEALARDIILAQNIIHPSTQLNTSNLPYAETNTLTINLKDKKGQIKDTLTQQNKLDDIITSLASKNTITLESLTPTNDYTLEHIPLCIDQALIENHSYVIRIDDDIQIFSGENDTSGSAITNSQSGSNTQETVQLTDTAHDDQSSNIKTLEIAGGGVLLAGIAALALSGGGNGDGGTSAVSGCIDPDATNYNASATIDDGSCEYTADVSDCMDSGMSTSDTGW